MAKILVFILIVLTLAFLTFALKEKLAKKTYPFFGLLFIVFIIFVVVYELYLKSQSEQREELVLAFFEAKSLLCKNKEVDIKHFNYDYATKSFIFKDKNQSIILSIKECKLNNE